MKLNLAIAPCSWGIEDPLNPENPPWRTVLNEAGESGFKAIELGPYGYLPTDALRLKELLHSKGLQLIAGTIYDDLSPAADIGLLTDKTRKICSLLSHAAETGERCHLVIIDAVKADRNNTAGHPGAAPRLGRDDWDKMIDHIKIISKIASVEFGVRPVIHPHAGGYIEFDDETERVVNDIPEKIAGLCLDTGHLYYACDDPAFSLKKYAERLDYVHFKDINATVYKQALNENMGFFDACAKGVMCSIGKGCVDYGSVFKTLDEICYDGWVTVEQERDPRDAGGTLDDLIESHDYLVSVLS